MGSRRILLAGAALLGGTGAAAWLAARTVEQRVVATIQRADASFGSIHFSWFSPLRLEKIALRPVAGASLTIDAAEVRWSPLGGRDVRTHVRGVTLHGIGAQHGPLTVDWPEAILDVLSWDGQDGGEHLRLRQRHSGGELEASWPTGGVGAREAVLALSRLDLSQTRVSWEGEAILDPGRWSGRVRLRRTGGRLESDGDLSGEAVRVAPPRTLALGSGEWGEPTHVVVGFDVVHEDEVLEVRRAAARLGGLDVDGRGRVARQATVYQVDLDIQARSDIGAALRTTGMALPAALRSVPADRLGTASLDLSLRGPLGDAAVLKVEPRLRFESAPEAVAALQFLTRPFHHTPDESPRVVIDVRHGAPDFLPFGEVPPLFVRALLLSEDAGFFGHPGIDVAEIPAAWARNAIRGDTASGASTITQQLVKNIFLARDKTYGRKLTEAALALVVDAAVPKARLLEIYVNVIEWGPGLYGLLPAARHYFGKAPAQLTPKEMAFLVCLIPSPVRYHHAHVAGRVGPGMEQLTQILLAKMLSVGAITEDEYAAAAVEELVFLPEAPALLPGGPRTQAAVTLTSGR